VCERPRRPRFRRCWRAQGFHFLIALHLEMPTAIRLRLVFVRADETGANRELAIRDGSDRSLRCMCAAQPFQEECMPAGDVAVVVLVALSLGWVAVAAARSRRGGS